MSSGLSTLLAAGRSIGMKRKPLGNITPNLNARRKMPLEKRKKARRYSTEEKIAASAERYLIESLCVKLEENATDHAVAKAGKSSGTTIPCMGHGAVTKLVASLQSTYPFLTISKMNNTLVARQKLRAMGKQPNEENNHPPPVNISPDCAIARPLTSTFGRPLGYNEERLARDNSCLPNGRLSSLIEEAKIKYGMPDAKISESTIKDHHLQEKFHNISGCGHTSPMIGVEDQIVELCIRMAKIRQPLSCANGLCLANSVIKGTETEKKVREWQEHNIKACKMKKGNLDDDDDDVPGLLKTGYWKGFMNRNKHRLVSKKSQKYALDRKDWSTYNNINQMYDDIYDEMTEAGVAVELETPKWVDRDRKEAEQSKTEGRKITHELIHPSYVQIMADEVGGDTSQKGDGHVGGVKFLCASGTVPSTGTSKNSNHFTTMCFTSGNGKPVMCLVIMTGVQQTTRHELGIDIFAEVVGTENDPDYHKNNIGPGKRFQGGPTCEFRGKTIPCMVRWSKKGGMTSEILTDCLRTMDEQELFPRVNGIKPFLIIDGHNSWLELPFLDYINNPDNEWCVCLGVPYGTAYFGKLATANNKTDRLRYISQSQSRR
eukprot:scaffold13838_cov51-Attheya_sp.AAC.1